MEAIRPIWESMQSHPLTDIDYFLEIVLSRPETLHPHVMLLNHDGSPNAMMVGVIEKKQLDLKIGYKTIYKPDVRSLKILENGCFGELSCVPADILLSELRDILARDEADVVNLTGLPVDSDIYRLAKATPGFLCRDRVSKADLHWEMRMPTTPEEFFQKIEGSRTLRRRIRQLERTFAGRVVYRLFQRTEHVEQLCRDAESIAKNTYQRGLGVGFIYDDEHKGRMIQASEHGWLRAYILYINGKPCAYWILTRYKKTCLSNFLGFDAKYAKYSPGLVLFAKIMEDLCQDPTLEKIDFGSGDAIYKKRFGDYVWQEADVMIYPPTYSGLKLNLMRTLILGFSQNLEMALARFGLLNRIKKNGGVILGNDCGDAHKRSKLIMDYNALSFNIIGKGVDVRNQSDQVVNTLPDDGGSIVKKGYDGASSCDGKSLKAGLFVQVFAV